MADLFLPLQQEDTVAALVSDSGTAATALGDADGGPDFLLLQQEDTGLASASDTAGRLTSSGLPSGCFRLEPTETGCAVFVFVFVLVLGVAWALDPQTQEPPLRHWHMKARWMVARWIARRAAGAR